MTRHIFFHQQCHRCLIHSRFLWRLTHADYEFRIKSTQMSGSSGKWWILALNFSLSSCGFSLFLRVSLVRESILRACSCPSLTMISCLVHKPLHVQRCEGSVSCLLTCLDSALWVDIITIHFFISHHIRVLSIALHHIKSHPITLGYSRMHYITLNYIISHHITLHRFRLL